MAAGQKRVMPRADDPIIAEVRRVRHKISAEHGHDTGRLVKHYQELETEMRKMGKYKFVNKTWLAKHGIKSAA